MSLPFKYTARRFLKSLLLKHGETEGSLGKKRFAGIILLFWALSGGCAQTPTQK